MKAALTTLAIVGLTLTAALPVWAHAHPERTAPRAGAVVKTPPQEVSILFDDDLQPGMNRIEVRDNGQLVSQGLGRQDAEQPRLVKVALRHPGKGTYTVKWRALAKDGHPTKGSFTFKVK